MNRAKGVLAVVFLCTLEVAVAQTDHPAKRHAGAGIWKSAVPPVGMKGEFGGHDPIGLANRQLIKADCSINWTDPDNGKLFCFSSPTSFGYFQEWPKRHARRAQAFWESQVPTQ